MCSVQSALKCLHSNYYRMKVSLNRITRAKILESLFSGVAQKVSFNVNAGTMPIEEETQLHVKAFGKNENMEFLVIVTSILNRFREKIIRGRMKRKSL